MEKAKADRIAEQEATGKDYSIPASSGKANRRGGDTDAMVFDTDFYTSHSFKPAVQQRIGEKSTQFMVNAKSLEVMTALYDLVKAEDPNATVSNKSWKIKFEGKQMSEPIKEEDFIIEQDPDEETKEEPVKVNTEPVVLASAQIAVELHEIEDGSKYLVSFTRKAGSNLAFHNTYDKMHQQFSELVEDNE